MHKLCWWLALGVALLLPMGGPAQPVILPPGAEGLDLSRYDAKNRAPTFSLAGSQVQLHAPRLKPDLMSRTLVKGSFRYVGANSLGVRLEDGTSQEYYCPGRLISALNMTEWLSDTPMCVGVYRGAEGRLAVVSAFPQTLVDRPESAVKVLLGWTPISPAGAPQLVLRSPVGESFLCVVSGPLDPQVVLAGKPVLPTPRGDNLKVYRDDASPWRVATWPTPQRTFALVCPDQDFAVLLEMFRDYVEMQAASRGPA